MIFTICLVTMILIITQDTNVIYEYFGLLLPKFNYEDMKEDFTYLEYLETFHNNFFTRLINCPYCLGFWISLIGLFYSCTMVPPIYIGSLLLYFLIKKLSK